MRRAVVNVGSGRYRNGTNRLKDKLMEFGSCDFISWTDPLPAEWPTHQEKQYAFKAHGLLAAFEMGYDQLLWIDSAVVPIRSLNPLWERIEKEGCWVPLNGWL